jgi:hypothetical protein
VCNYVAPHYAACTIFCTIATFSGHLCLYNCINCFPDNSWTSSTHSKEVLAGAWGNRRLPIIINKKTGCGAWGTMCAPAYVVFHHTLPHVYSSAFHGWSFSKKSDAMPRHASHGGHFFPTACASSIRRVRTRLPYVLRHTFLTIDGHTFLTWNAGRRAILQQTQRTIN